MPKQCTAGILSLGFGLLGFAAGYKFSHAIFDFLQTYVPHNHESFFAGEYEGVGAGIATGFAATLIAAYSGHYLGVGLDSLSNYLQARKTAKEYQGARNVITDLRKVIKNKVQTPEENLEKKADTPDNKSLTTKFKLRPTDQK